jgi:hypothetical protein
MNGYCLVGSCLNESVDGVYCRDHGAAPANSGSTHRIVPLELLHAIEIDLTTECTNFDTLNKLRAIIEG